MKVDRGVDLLLSGRRWLIVFPFRLHPENREHIVAPWQLRSFVPAWFDDVNTYYDMVRLHEELTGNHYRPPKPPRKSRMRSFRG